MSKRVATFVLNVVMVLVLVFLLSRIALLFGGGLLLGGQGEGKCYSVNLLDPMVYTETPCRE